MHQVVLVKNETLNFSTFYVNDMWPAPFGNRMENKQENWIYHLQRIKRKNMKSHFSTKPASDSEQVSLVLSKSCNLLVKCNPTK